MLIANDGIEIVVDPVKHVVSITCGNQTLILTLQQLDKFIRALYNVQAEMTRIST